MKKIFAALSFLLLAGFTTVFAGDNEKVDPKVAAAFQKEFSAAEQVKWDVTEKVSTARFLINDQAFTAYFSSDAELLGIARNLLFNQLPLSVIRELEENYGDAEISGIVELSRNNETSYFLHATIKDKKYQLRAYATGQVSIVKKIKQ